MVVISASICNKNGKILVARQFIPITRLKLEEYMANFPKLIESGKQCTHIETESIRYVYLPMEKLFLVLITNKNSNIIEDLEVIRLLHQVVIQQCQQGLDDKVVMKKAFDLILTFDDVISCGHRESVTMPQLESYLEMDSTDEKMHKKMQLIREAEAREFAKKQQKEISKRKHDPAYKDNMKSMSSSDYQANPAGVGPAQIQGVGSSGSNAGFQALNKPQTSNYDDSTQLSQAKKIPGKAMQLGKPKKQNELMKDLQKEKLFSKPQDAYVEETKAQETIAVNPLLENVVIEIEEKVNCSINKDGELDRFEVKGIIFVTLNDPKKNNPLAQLQFNPVKGFNFKPHPELDKQTWNKQKTICAADKEQGFPAQTRLDAVRYNYRSKDEGDLPFTVNVFNSKKQNKSVITLEIELNQNCNLSFKSFERVTLALSWGNRDTDIEVLKIAKNQQLEQDQKNDMLLWHVSNLMEEGSSVLSFASEKIQFEEIFPIEVRFEETYSLIDLGVTSVQNVSTGDALSLKTIHSLTTENYRITE
ncbi:coatomer subunit delta [Stylonychia lemnae]|uniref:Coatomer subunit delta n=1 Tax=Stylonychia lemnae TaxID=5949 RepID=A0A078B5I2_STYLE|nr:coatomer subunit delta [Stylonychia lemnae]|eukprot:CDW88783.1 coatomer subunit delta [Stylonychia lemnae]